MWVFNDFKRAFFIAVYGINNILYQRGIYPPEMFKQEKKYGLTILVTTDQNLLTYLNDNVLPQLTGMQQYLMISTADKVNVASLMDFNPPACYPI